MAPQPAELDPATLKLQHAIVYDANTSETKDDLPALVAILVSSISRNRLNGLGF